MGGTHPHQQVTRYSDREKSKKSGYKKMTEELTEGGIFDPTVYRGGLQTKFISSLDKVYIKFRQGVYQV